MQELLVKRLDQSESRKKITIAEYALKRLKSLGVDHLFGIPGDFILPFFEKWQTVKSNTLLPVMNLMQVTPQTVMRG